MAKAKKTAKKAAAKGKVGAKKQPAGSIREGSKIDKTVKLMQRKTGVTIDQLEETLDITTAGARSLVNDVKRKGKKVTRDGKKYVVAA